MSARTPTYPRRARKGAVHAASLLEARIRKVGESRGFSSSRVLTHWPEIVGSDIAAIARPVNVSYGRGLGATLTLLTTGAQAQMLQMQTERIREKVNACYGWNAISRIRITQSAPTGFAEGRVAFDPAPKSSAAPPDPALARKAADESSGIADTELREALSRLGASVLAKDTKR